MTESKNEHGRYQPPPASAFGDEGLTRREYFAAHAPTAIAQGISELSDRKVCELLGIDPEDEKLDLSGPASARRALKLLAKRHYEYADEMLQVAAPPAVREMLKALEAIAELDPADVKESFWKARNLANYAAQLATRQGVGR